MFIAVEDRCQHEWEYEKKKAAVVLLSYCLFCVKRSFQIHTVQTVLVFMRQWREM